MSASATQGGHNKQQQQWPSGYNGELYHSIPSLIHINTSVSYWWRQKRHPEKNAQVLRNNRT